MSNFQAHTLVGTIACAPYQTQDERTIFTLDLNELLSNGNLARSQVSVVTRGELAAEARTYSEGERVLVEAVQVRGFAYTVPDSQEIEAQVAYNATFLLPLGPVTEDDHDLQRHIVVGHLGADPLQTTTPSGALVTNFDLAVNGNGDNPATWYRVAAWGALGETCANYLYKGRLVLVNGNVLKARVWHDQNNNLRTSLDLTARSLTFLDRPSGDGALEAVLDTPPVPVVSALSLVRRGNPGQGQRGGSAVDQRTASVSRGSRAPAPTRQPIDVTRLRRQSATVVDAARQAALEAYKF